MNVYRLEESFKAMAAKGVKVPAAHYVFNRFDVDSPTDQQARDLVSRICGNRLLPISVCDAVEVNEAMAARMTIADFAPQSEVAQSCQELALWVRKAAPVNATARRPGRWSER
jgi:MinD-like ATPase involved in chromosome partitioning or flagellar assembly